MAKQGTQSVFQYCKYNNYELKRGAPQSGVGGPLGGGPPVPPHGTRLHGGASACQCHCGAPGATLRFGLPWGGSNLLVPKVPVQQGLPLVVAEPLP